MKLHSQLGTLAVVGWFGSGFALATPTFDEDVSVTLPATAWDMVVDVPRQQIYVSIPTLNEVTVISMPSFTIADHWIVGPSPHGMDLSLDGSQLFVALNQAGAVAAVDLSTHQVTEIVVATQLGSALAYDVMEGAPNQVFVSGSPDSGGLAWIARIRLDQGNAVDRVASNTIIRAEPAFARSPDHTHLYIGEGFSPESLYRLDLTQPNAPIDLQADFGSVYGMDRLLSDHSGNRLYAHYGQVLRTTDLTQAGVIGQGISQFGDDDSRIYVASGQNQITVFDTTTFLQTDQFTLPCNWSTPREMAVLPNGGGFLVLAEDHLCGRSSPGGCTGSIASYCSTSPNSVGAGATIGSQGTPSLSANDLALTADGCPPRKLGLFFMGQGRASLPFGDGLLCIDPYASRLIRLQPAVSTDAAGHAFHALDFSAPPLLHGPIHSFTTWNFQLLYRDPHGPGGTGTNTTNALEVTFCP